MKRKMASENQDSLESEHISLLHDRILQENNNFSYLDSQLSQKALLIQREDSGRYEQVRARHVPNSKVQRMKAPRGSAPTADMAPRESRSLVKHMTFHGFPIDLDGDTQPMPSQFYTNYAFSNQPQTDDSTHTDDATTHEASNHIDLVQDWQEPAYHPISSDNSDNESDTGRGPADQDEAQYFLSSVNRPTFPKTPATTGRKGMRGDLVSTASTKTPGSGLSAFDFGTGAPLSTTQLFQGTQAPSSPVPEFPRSDPLLTRPSPVMRHSSPGLIFGSESPSKQMQSPSRSMDALGKLRRPHIPWQMSDDAQHDDDEEEEEEEEEMGNQDQDADNDDNINDEDDDGFAFDLDDVLHNSPGNESVDEYDEFAQDILPSQRQPLSSPSHRSNVEDGHARPSSRTSAQSKPINPPDANQAPRLSHPSDSQQARHEPPAVEREIMDTEASEFAVADSQRTPTETQPPPPPIVEPSSMSSIVQGSYPPASSQTRARLDALRRDMDDSSSIPKPPPTTSQVGLPTQQQRLPSSPPQLPAVFEENAKDETFNLDPHTRREQNCPNGGVSSPLPETQHETSQRTNGLKKPGHHQSSAVPETDPADKEETQAPSLGQSLPLLKLGTTLTQLQYPITQPDDAAINAIPSSSQFSKRRTTQIQSQASGLGESPRKAAGILNFADIATDPTPPDAANDIDLNIDLLSNEDQDFLDVISSPPQQPAAKRMRMYGKKGRIFEKRRKSAEGVKFQTSKKQQSPVPFEVTIPKTQKDDIATHVVVPTHESPIQKDTGPIFPKSEQETDVQQIEQAVNESVAEPQRPVPTDDHILEEETSNVQRSNNIQDQQSTQAPSEAVQTPPPARKPEVDTQSIVRSRDPSLVRKKRDTRGVEINNVRGRLVRPNRRTSEQSPLRTPIRTPNEAPKSKLSHVEPVPDVPVELLPIVPVEETPHSKANDTADVIMTDAESSHNESDNTNVITQPDRVLALFKGTGQAYYPATCLGASTINGQKLRIRFDDGTVTQLDSLFVRRLELRRGDQVKVDLPGLRSKAYIVMNFKDKIQEIDQDTYPKTDVFGFEMIELVPKDRDSMAIPKVESAALLRVPITNVYLTQTMWVRFDDRSYLPTTASVGLSSRIQTPVTQRPVPATPGSRSRRLTMMSNNSRPDLASPLPPGRGVFAGMAFAVSYSSDDAAVRTEKDRVLALIQAHGGLVLEKGFDELFETGDLTETSETPLSKRASSVNDGSTTNDNVDGEMDALALGTRAQNLGFVALIADRHSRRAKYVQALALSLPCLAGRWVCDSVTAGRAVEWPKYLLPAGESAYLSGAIRSRTLPSYDVASASLSETVRNRVKLLSGGRVLLVAQPGKAKWEARKPYAFLTLALGASAVKRVAGIDAAKKILDEEKQSWKYVYVEGKVDEARKALFGGTEQQRPRKRKRGTEDGEEEVQEMGNDGVQVVGDEFVVQSLILGALV